jgi:hypothetical protein
VGIIYKEDGGDKSDGVIFVRPGVKDLDMGHSRYAQVRIAIDGTHYLKGMAVYKDDMPPGVDLHVQYEQVGYGKQEGCHEEVERRS